MPKNTVVVYFEMKNHFIKCYDGVNIFEIEPKSKDFKTCNYFEMFKGYNATEEDLIRFRSDLIRWSDELQQETKMPKYFEYINNSSHSNAVEYFYHLMENKIHTSKSKDTQRQIDNMRNIEHVNFEEFLFMEDCYNNGIMTLDPKYKDVETMCYGYDFTEFYPSILNCIPFGLSFASKQGTQYKLTELDYAKAKYGIYRVKITCNHPHFKKVFAFSKKHTYTHYSLKFAYEHKEMFDVRFELIQDVEYNALIYEPSCLVKTDFIFDRWFKTLKEIKDRYKQEKRDNKLIKHLFTSLWGSLCKYWKIYVDDTTEDKITDYDKYHLLNSKPKVKMVDGIPTAYYTDCYCSKEQPYKFEMARLKPFMLSVCRNIVGGLLIRNKLLDNTIRIYIDGIILDKEHTFLDAYKPIPEAKNTKVLTWYNQVYNNETRANKN